MAAVEPTIAQSEGIISRYRGILLPASINNPKVKIVEGHGKPNDMVWTADLLIKYPIKG